MLCDRTTAMNADGTQNTGNSDDNKDLAEMYGILVSHKCLTKFLNCHVISSTTIACSLPPPISSVIPLDLLTSFVTHVGICANHCMILYVYIGDVSDAGGVLTFYVPAQFDEPI